MQRDLLDFFRYGVTWVGAAAAQLTGPRSGALLTVLNAIASSLPDHRDRCGRGVVLGWAVLGGLNQGKSYGRSSVFDALARLEALGLITRERRILRGGKEETAVTRLTPVLLQAAWAWSDARKAARKLRAELPARTQINLPLASPNTYNSDSTLWKTSSDAAFRMEESNGWTHPSNRWTLTSHTPAPPGRGFDGDGP